MSVTEESELQDLVKQTLEKSGSMSKLRAELRASVFLALEENGCFENLKTKNNHLQEFAKNNDGLLLLCLIREFLEYYGLSFTASVFDPELASYGIECDCKDYLKLGNQLNIASNYSDKRKRGPLLCEMIQIFRDFQNSSSQKSKNHSNAEEPSQLNTSKSDTSTEYLQLQPTSSPQKKELDFEDVINSNSENNHAKFNSGLSISPAALGHDANSFKYSLSSLGDLPPLSSPNSQNKISSSSNSSKQIHKLKAILMDPSILDSTEDLSNSSVITEDENENEKVNYDMDKVKRNSIYE